MLKLIKDVEKDESGWIDYGDEYWEGHAADSEGLTEESRAWKAATRVLKLMEGTSTKYAHVVEEAP